MQLLSGGVNSCCQGKCAVAVKASVWRRGAGALCSLLAGAAWCKMVPRYVRRQWQGARYSGLT